MKRMLSICLALLLILTVIPVASMALSQYGYVTGGWLRLRSSASFDSSTISSYYTGTQVKILASTGNWYQVQAPDGNTGYMYASYISFSGGGTGTAYITSANGYGVRMRSGPGTGYGVIGVYSVGTAVTVLQTGTYWSKITIGSRTGYVMNKFLSTSGGGGGTGYSATVWSANGYGVRLRSGAGTGYSVIGVYSVGTVVTVLSHGVTWDHVSVGSRTGYMMNSYLRTTGLGTATGITLTPATANAAQGSTLALTSTVSGTNLSSPSYTLSITQNASMATLSGDNLLILGTATIGSVIQVTATTVDNGTSGSKLTATCNITVTPSTGVVTSFSFDKTTATATVSSAGANIDVVPTILGTNLTSPYFTLAVSSNASSYVTATRNASTGNILISMSSTIPNGTVFTVTGTSLNTNSGGSVLTATITVTVSTTGTLSGITITPASTSINQGATTTIGVRLTYSNGSYVNNPSSGTYSLSVTGGSTYGSLAGNVLTGLSFAGTTDQTVTITGASTENASLTSTCTVTVKALRVPSAPTLVTAKAENAQVQLTWSAPTDNGGSAIIGYKVYYSSTATMGSSPYTTISSPTTYTATVGGLTNGTLYYFWVSAYNAQGDSSASNSLSATPNVSVPDAPTGLTVSSSGDGTVTVSWTAPAYDGGAAIAEYNIYYGGTSYTTSSTTSKAITGLTNGTTYSIYVKARNSQGEGAASNTVTATPAAVPGAPTNVAATGAVAVTWTAPANNGSTITGYTVKYSTDSGFGTFATQTSTTTSCNVTITTAGTWYFKVYATNAIGNSADSASASTVVEQVATPTFDQMAGTYNDSVSVQLSCSTSGVTIRYTLDGTDPTSSSTAYSTALSITTSTTIKAKAFATGKLDSAVASAAYTIKVGTVPSFTPIAGSYTGTQSVTLSATSGDAIYYTIDGSSPTTGSTLYSGAVSVAVTTTIKAIAARTGCASSDIASAIYTITP